MISARGLRDLFVGTDTSVAERMRLRRWGLIRSELPDLPEMNVVDLGGTLSWWERAPVRPRHVTVVNLAADSQETPWLTSVTGNACDAVSLLAGESFDLVFSNSLIEHVGGHNARRALARSVRALAPRYFVQTPYRYFPVEPHWIFPGMQFLPLPLRRRLAPSWPLGHTRGWEPRAALDEVMSTELIGATEMRAYFPDARIRWERVLGIPKSIVAIRS